ncbi:Uu.00g044090.m01.CDS01 [Anthostomella pinea]|uniref:Uu.00g044090.m01.CDS01 n=1 Tax=Anthostomella pinea TaxID=933095 RepID=A0AAI8YE69_9PEZI|nr:Uu.00g044090.m01.CDS01 [Anthostomella pinea]
MSVRMEQHRLPKRSASHGTLRSSYSAQGRLVAVGPSPSRPLHKPLRSVAENSVLLPSPGALESMLKTTTETGDIGIFSIKPVPPSPQRRSTFSEIGRPNPPPRRSIDELYRQDMAKRPPSNRDTTSENLSTYGTESQKSGTSTLSPTSTDDIGQRSYSMTTCGSRYLSHYKSTTTLQSQGSGSHLQRPRSPFPYPTRLKRPGVRPASPALTENGRVDYSRMVEIDRISYRTMHGRLKPSYPSMPRRPHVLGLRANANHSTPSLPISGPPPNFRGPLPPPSIRTHSAASMASWNAPLRERLHVDSAGSRSSSLTSLANMYQRIPPVHRPGSSALSAPAPRYYDYTEDFESKTTQITTPAQPLAPVPTRAPNCQRPLILQESDDHLAAVFGEGDSAFFDIDSQEVEEPEANRVSHLVTSRSQSHANTPDQPSSRRGSGSTRSRQLAPGYENSEISRNNTQCSDIDLLPSQVRRDSIDTFNPSLDLESRDMPAYNYTAYRLTATPKTKANSPERQVQVLGGRTPTIRSEQGVILRDDAQDEAVSTEVTIENSRTQINEEAVVPHSANDNVTQLRSLSGSAQGLSKTSDQQVIVDDHRRSVFTDLASFKNDQAGSSSDESENLAASKSDDLPSPGTMDTSPAHPKMEALNDTGIKEAKCAVQEPADEASEAALRLRFRRHRRNQAVLRISTTGLPREDNEGFPHLTPSYSTTPLISPKPISPTRQLKVKNSIPQLMKALPPLPGDSDYISPQTPTAAGEEDEFAEVLAPFSFPDPDPLAQGPFKNPSAAQSASSLPRVLAQSTQKALPKSGLKLKTSNSSENPSSSGRKHRSTDVEHGSVHTPDTEVDGNSGDRDARVRARNRLKLKSSRRTGIQSPPTGSFRRYPVAKASDAVTELTSRKPQDLFTKPTEMNSMLRQVNHKSSQLPNGDTPAFRARTEEIFPYEASHQSEGQVSLASTSHTMRTSRHKGFPANNNSGVKHTRGLKMHLSNLRSLLALRPSTSHVPTTVPHRLATDVHIKTNDIKEDHVGLTNVRISSGPSTVIEVLSTTGSMRAPVGRRIRVKLSKWVKGTRRAVRKRVNMSHGA